MERKKREVLPVVLALFFSACSPGPLAPALGSGGPLDASRWMTLSSGIAGSRVYGHAFLSNSEGALRVEIPTLPRWVEYLFTAPASHQLVGPVSASLQAVTTQISFGTQRSNTCPGEPEAHLYFVVDGDDKYGEFNRWWGGKPIVLAAGGSVSIPIDPALWSSVYGKLGSAAVEQWTYAIAHVTSVGMTFGGGCYLGHGVFSTLTTPGYVVLTNFTDNSRD